MPHGDDLHGQAQEVSRTWYMVDAEGKTLGRLGSPHPAGKQPIYTPHVDTGDYVIVISAERSSSAKSVKTNCTFARPVPWGLRVRTTEVLATNPTRSWNRQSRMLPKPTGAENG